MSPPCPYPRPIGVSRRPHGGRATQRRASSCRSNANPTFIARCHATPEMSHLSSRTRPNAHRRRRDMPASWRRQAWPDRPNASHRAPFDDKEPTGLAAGYRYSLRSFKWATTKTPKRHDQAKCRQGRFITIQGICPGRRLAIPNVMKTTMPSPWITAQRSQKPSRKGEGASRMLVAMSASAKWTSRLVSSFSMRPGFPWSRTSHE